MSYHFDFVGIVERVEVAFFDVLDFMPVSFFLLLTTQARIEDDGIAAVCIATRESLDRCRQIHESCNDHKLFLFACDGLDHIDNRLHILLRQLARCVEKDAHVGILFQLIRHFGNLWIEIIGTLSLALVMTASFF